MNTGIYSLLTNQQGANPCVGLRCTKYVWHCLALYRPTGLAGETYALLQTPIRNGGLLLGWRRGVVVSGVRQ